MPDEYVAVSLLIGVFNINSPFSHFLRLIQAIYYFLLYFFEYIPLISGGPVSDSLIYQANIASAVASFLVDYAGHSAGQGYLNSRPSGHSRPVRGCPAVGGT